jgi:hypothetical protein
MYSTIGLNRRLPGLVVATTGTLAELTLTSLSVFHHFLPPFSVKNSKNLFISRRKTPIDPKLYQFTCLVSKYIVL